MAKKCECGDIFTEEERKHLEEVLHGDLDGYWEEIKDMSTTDDFDEWKKKSARILKKCDLNEWSIEGVGFEDDKPKHIKDWEEFMKKQREKLNE